MAQVEKTKKDNGKDVMLTEDVVEGAVRGRITLHNDVVATIAAMCARQIPGIHALGKPRLIDFGGGRTRGVEVELGQKQVAIDLDVVMDYGTDIQKCAEALRSRMAQEIEVMTSRKVVEVNVHVSDIHLPEEEKIVEPVPVERPRVI